MFQILISLLQLPRSAHLCHTCWRRTDRLALRSLEDQQSDIQSGPSSADTDSFHAAQGNEPVKLYLIVQEHRVHSVNVSFLGVMSQSDC